MTRTDSQAVGSERTTREPEVRFVGEDQGYNKKLLPLTGVVFFFQNPSLWGLACGFCCLQLLVLIATTVVVWGTFPAQREIIENLFSQEWEAIMSTVLIIMTENVVIYIIIVYLIILPCILDRIFRTVFALRNVPWSPTAGSCCIDCCRGLYVTVLFVVVMLISLPLNLIPVVGWLCWTAATAFFITWELLNRYFDHKKLPFSAAWSFARAHFFEFWCFGCICILLTFIPLASFVLMYTNLVACALWATDIERYELLRPHMYEVYDSVEMTQYGDGTEQMIADSQGFDLEDVVEEEEEDRYYKGG